jgi:fructan beta-fructosidase
MRRKADSFSPDCLVSIAIRTAVLTLLLSSLMAAVGAADPDIVLADFEGPDYGNWKTTGEAFGTGPARGALPGQMSVTGFAGKGLANSFHQGDKTTGTLSSPEFVISRRYLGFLIGGGGFEGKTCINLLVNGNTVRTATGPNRQPGGSEKLEPHQWDLSDLAGKTARIEIVDQASGGWGHINVDQVVLTDQKAPSLIANVERTLKLNRKYLNFPVKTGAPKRRVALLLEDRITREFEIELAEGDPDFWVFLDVEAFKGRNAVIRVDKMPENAKGLAAVANEDSLRDAANLYAEKLRPQFHFSSRRGWNNDPNGLVFSKGEYHLFYQHNPYGWSWGNMHWGHAVSQDLVHWKELPIALYPRQFGDWAFSGSAVSDQANTAGFKSGGEDVLVAAFTSTGRGECLVYSNDRGRTWNEYEGNPVVRHTGRDPKLLWHSPTRKWVMAVYDEAEKVRYIAFYTSPDLKNWEFQSRIEGFYECPDLFELPVDRNPAMTRWVLTAASSEYVIGRFDGRKFTPESAKLPGQRGSMRRRLSVTSRRATDGESRLAGAGWRLQACPSTR